MEDHKDSIEGGMARFEAWLDQEPLRRQVIEFLRAEEASAYVVGGSVRDALLGRSSFDLDLAIDGHAMPLARRLANALDGAYVPLDKERHVARVVVPGANGISQHVDLAGLRAEGIVADLWARDLTVNAMAVAVSAPDTLIDPTGGQADLVARVLRLVRAEALIDDPLRVLRVVRLHGALGFRVDAETEVLARRHASLLSGPSAERLRDELVLILELDDAAGALAYGAALGVWDVVLPELNPADLEQGLAAVRQLETLFSPWMADRTDAPLPEVVQPYADGLRKHWAKELSVGRNRWEALKLAALLGRLGPRGARKVALRLRLSTREARFIEAALAGAQTAEGWGAAPEPLAVFRYYQQVEDAGADGAILALCRRAEGGGQLVAVRALLDAWFQQRARLVHPPQLLSGSDLMEVLGIEAGPEVGFLLAAIQEAQVRGEISSRGEALRFAVEWEGRGGNV
ncbi:MAG: tRNA nucleotidyltransferase/poly(A) polymerase family protein [Anaerolineae bacterium]